MGLPKTFCAYVASTEDWPGQFFCHIAFCFSSYSDMYGKFSIIYELSHGISNNVVCATSKASDQPAHMRRAFASHLNILDC